MLLHEMLKVEHGRIWICRRNKCYVVAIYILTLGSFHQSDTF